MKKVLPWMLALLGLLQITGDVTGVEAVRGVAAATAASPAPKVFSAVRGLETYSTRFFIELGGRRIAVTPELYARLRGPYNRRNVYGAALAYAPVLPPAIRDAVLRHALCGESPMLRELGIERGAAVPVIVLEPREGTSVQDLPMRFAAPCR